MNILFDTQIFDRQINGGISRYFIEVIKRLDTDSDNKVMFSCAHSYNTYIQDTKWLKTSAKFQNINFKGKLKLVKEINEIINRRYSDNILKASIQDVFHPTFYDPYFLKLINNKPFVLTVYDLTNERYNDNSVLTRQFIEWKKKLITSANHIISISENTKNDIVSFYNINPEKITTIYLSGGFDKIEKISETVPSNYILFVGSRIHYKNFDGFITMAAGVLIKYDLKLVVVGGGNFTAKEMELLNSLQIYNRIILHPHVSDESLMHFYSNALLFVFPSLYEGFGIPVLEAMQCGCPVLLSDNSSLPEVGGNAAEYFDPFQPDDLKDKLERLVINADKRLLMKQMGLGQISKFNWDITAQNHQKVYQRVTSN
jgi:glycosyltransferase involved in cell wall biosynthesis